MTFVTNSASGPPTALKHLARKRLYEELETVLKAYIVETGMAPGDKFPTERELADQLRVSRATVRQATVALEVQGIVEVRHGDGVYLLRLNSSADELKELLKRRQRLPEILEARETLECRLAYLAASRRSESDVSAMRLALKSMAQDIADGGNGSLGDAAFHAAITKAAKNEILAFLMNSIAKPIQESREESLNEPGRPPRSLAAHQRICDAITQQDCDGALEAMRAHLRVVADVELLRWHPTQI